MFKNKNILILGHGQIGKALEKIYKKKFNIFFIEKDTVLPDTDNQYDVLNVCIPYDSNFINIVNGYIKKYNPKLTIIHSTVYPDTTKNILSNTVVYSPVIGIHPHLKKSIKTFKKFIGADNKKSLFLAKKHFNKLKIKYKVLQNSKTVEVAKLISTLYYGMCISFHDDINNLCKEKNINYDHVMTEWNKEYNSGYKKLGMHNVIRPVLKPANGKIGGHCIIPNAKLLKDYFKSSIVDYVLRLK